MQTDGNLVLYQNPGSDQTAIWASNTQSSGATATLQGSDGNLVVYGSDGTALWASGTGDFPGDEITMQDDGNAVIYHQGHAIWTQNSGYIGWELYSGASLASGDYMYSPGRQYEVVMQTDGNLVEYENPGPDQTAVFDSGTSSPGATVTLQSSDGNFVIYSASGSPIWSSGTGDFPSDGLALQDDGNLVIYHDGHAIWSRGGGYIGDRLQDQGLNSGAYLMSPNRGYELVMQADGNLVEYQNPGPNQVALWAEGGGAGAVTEMQSDGNLVIYNNGFAKWASATAGDINAQVVLQNDGNLVIYNGSTAVWDRQSGNLTTPSGPGQSQGQDIVNDAEQYLGDAYCWSGGQISPTPGPSHGTGDSTEWNGRGADSGCNNSGPEASVTGFDCSGLAMVAVYEATGVVLPHNSKAQSTAGGQVIGNDLANAQPGDLLFFGGSTSDIYHVGIYMGNGQMINAYDYKNDGDNGPNGENEYWGVTEMPVSFETHAAALQVIVRY